MPIVYAHTSHQVVSESSKDLFNERVTPPREPSEMSEHFSKFSGNNAERAYLTYFASGDLGTSWHGRKVRIEMGTTHPAQLELVSDLFGKYSKPIIYPAKKSGEYCWRIVCHLDKSFVFLILKPERLHANHLNDDILFYSALSGFADAEGHIGLRESGGKAYSVFTLSNRNKQILSDFKQGLRARGFRANVYGLKGKSGIIQWQLEIYGTNVLELLTLLKPRHREKVQAKNAVSQNHGKPWAIAGRIYKTLRKQVLNERNKFIQEAGEAYLHRDEKKLHKTHQIMSRASIAYSLWIKGSSIDEISYVLGCSIRTVYRLLLRHRIMESG